MTTPLLERCCFCQSLKPIADIDSKVVYGKQVTLHYCSDCLGVEAPTTLVKHPKPKPDPQALVLEVLEEGGSLTLAEIRSRVGKKVGIRAIQKTLASLATSEAIAEEKIYTLAR